MHLGVRSEVLSCLMHGFFRMLFDFISYAFSDSLLLTPLCCDDIHDVTPWRGVTDRAFGYREVVLFRPTGYSIAYDSKEEPIEEDPLDEPNEEGMDWLSKRMFVIVCHETVVRIPLEGDEILRVHGERTQGVVKTLMNTKVDEPKLSDISAVRDFIDVFQKHSERRETSLGVPTAADKLSSVQFSSWSDAQSRISISLATLEMQELVLAQEKCIIVPASTGSSGSCISLAVPAVFRKLNHSEVLEALYYH
ncbi:hypothetical protein Tco_1394362 [Tanacetum coccineum]